MRFSINGGDGLVQWALLVVGLGAIVGGSLFVSDLVWYCQDWFVISRRSLGGSFLVRCLFRGALYDHVPGRRVGGKGWYYFEGTL